jgi:hypothetical protein
VQSDREHAEAERLRALEQLVRGIVERIARIVVGVDVEISLDPVVASGAAASRCAMQKSSARPLFGNRLTHRRRVFVNISVPTGETSSIPPAPRYRQTPPHPACVIPVAKRATEALAFLLS